MEADPVTATPRRESATSLRVGRLSPEWQHLEKRFTVYDFNNPKARSSSKDLLAEVPISNKSGLLAEVIHEHEHENNAENGATPSNEEKSS